MTLRGDCFTECLGEINRHDGYIVELENLNRGLIDNLEELVNGAKLVADIFETLNTKLSKGVSKKC